MRLLYFPIFFHCNRSDRVGLLKYWNSFQMMRNLLLDEGDFIQVESVSLPTAVFSKFEPQNVEFLDISNQKAVLENALRNFACLTTDDVIAIKYNERIYEMRVLEVRPGNAVSIIECDMNVEFAAPVGYQEPQKVDPQEAGAMEEEHEVLPEPKGFLAFLGSGNRLDGKKKNLTMTREELSKVMPKQRGVPDYDYEIGYIKFWRTRTKTANEDKDQDNGFEAFQGAGTSLRKSRKL